MVLAQSIQPGGINSAADIVAAFNARTANIAAVFVSGTPDHVLTSFKGPVGPRVLVVVGRLLEGFDYRNVSVCAIYRNVARKSKVSLGG
jgi:hypothetical protein